MSWLPDESKFPVLTAAELALLRPMAQRVQYADGATVFRRGDAELDLFVVEEGAIEIRIPGDNAAVIATHRSGQFAGDIDLLTGRPVSVGGVARGPTRVLRVPHAELRMLLNRLPSFGEKLMVALIMRREALSRSTNFGLKVVGAGHCKETNLIREFLYKNFVPYSWIDSETPAGLAALAQHGEGCKPPIVDCGEGRVLQCPTLHAVAVGAGVWQKCPEDQVDLAIVGAGPAGIAAAVYAASEGLSTLLLDRLGPGGQAGGSSKIENFIGFPAGLSGAELSTRGVLQMLKFGARMVAPVLVQRIVASGEAAVPHELHLDCGAIIKSKVVLIASGVRWRKLQAAGADRFEGAGVHYVCTAVEAVLYDKCDVVVVGGGNSAGQAVMYLAECCPNRHVHLLLRNNLESGMSEYLVGRVRGAENVTVHEHTEIASVEGDQQLEAVQLARRDGSQIGRLACSGVFVFIGADPAAEWVPPEVARDSLGYILTGNDTARTGRWPLTHRGPCPLETTLPGILAAGDIRAGSTKRVGFAVGDGSLAVTCTHTLLSLRV
jgi:thioredoxin reductase (NADPH)